MFGISAMELLVILVVAIAVIPSKDWPNVVRWIAKFIRGVRNMAGKIEDQISEFENTITKDLPIDKLSQKTMDDMIASFSTPVNQRTSAKSKKPAKRGAFRPGPLPSQLRGTKRPVKKIK